MPQLGIELYALGLIQRSEVEYACGMEIGIAFGKLSEHGHGILIHGFRMFYDGLERCLVYHVCMGFSCGGAVSPILPVGHGCVEYLVGNVLNHLCDEVFLHAGELLAGVVLGGG